MALGVRATTPDGDGPFAWTTVTPTGDAAPVGAHRSWAVPSALLGASTASTIVGGVSDGAIDLAGEALLHDGSAIGGGGIEPPVTDPATFTTVDLAGDDPVTVVGTILDPASGLDELSERPRGFELWPRRTAPHGRRPWVGSSAPGHRAAVRAGPPPPGPLRAAGRHLDVGGDPARAGLRAARGMARRVEGRRAVGIDPGVDPGHRRPGAGRTRGDVGPAPLGAA
ncbi:MAG: hypothetical protein R3C32_13930 [Chloroflexota bacterium]